MIIWRYFCVSSSRFDGFFSLLGSLCFCVDFIWRRDFCLGVNNFRVNRD